MVEVFVVMAELSFCLFVFDSECFEGFVFWDVYTVNSLMDDDFSIFGEIGVLQFDLRVDRFSKEDGVWMQKFCKHLSSSPLLFFFKYYTKIY